MHLDANICYVRIFYDTQHRVFVVIVVVIVVAAVAVIIIVIQHSASNGPSVQRKKDYYSIIVSIRSFMPSTRLLSRYHTHQSSVLGSLVYVARSSDNSRASICDF